MSTTASSSRAFSVPAGIKPEAAAAHYAWNASLNAMDPDKKFICPIPSCGRGFKRCDCRAPSFLSNFAAADVS
jgi:hypothetical protein